MRHRLSGETPGKTVMGLVDIAPYHQIVYIDQRPETIQGQSLHLVIGKNTFQPKGRCGKCRGKKKVLRTRPGSNVSLIL